MQLKKIKFVPRIVFK